MVHLLNVDQACFYSYTNRKFHSGNGVELFRVTQKVTVKNVEPQNDAMLLIAYRIEPDDEKPVSAVPRIIDLDVFSMIELVEARDKRMASCGGRWFGNYETPTILSKIGKKKASQGLSLNTSSYGRKEPEGKDFNEDTNFGKLKRIPHSGLQAFLKKYRLNEGDEETVTDALEKMQEITEGGLQEL